MQENKQWRRSSNFIQSCQFAWNGIRLVIKQEQNLKWQFFAFAMVLIASLLLNLEKIYIVVVILISAIVLSFEIANSAVEMLANIIEPEYNNQVRVVKDVMAGSVLMASFMALLVGLVIFGPFVIDLFS